MGEPYDTAKPRRAGTLIRKLLRSSLHVLKRASLGDTCGVSFVLAVLLVELLLLMISIGKLLHIVFLGQAINGQEVSGHDRAAVR